MAAALDPARKQKRLTAWRVVAFATLHALILLHLALWYWFDWRVIGAIDAQELFRHWLEENLLTAGALFFLVAIALGLVWGRFFCGWLCHIGQTYDLIASLFRKWRIPMRPFPLRLGPYAALALLIYYFLAEALVNRLDAEPEPFAVDWGAVEPWALLPGWLWGVTTLALALIVMPMALGPRAFCRTLCPWGVLFGVFNRASPYKIRRTGDCTVHGACSRSCPMDLDVSRLINERYHVSASACVNCMQCVAVCPENALRFSLPRAENRAPQRRPLLPKPARASWPVELAFWAMTAGFGFIYTELYGIGVFLAYIGGALAARLTIAAAVWARRQAWPGRVAPALLALAIWGVAAKDGAAKHYYVRGHQAWEARDFDRAQTCYERSDALFWQSPNVLFYRLYAIYKQTGQEQKRLHLYDRYEARRQAQGKGDAPRKE